MYKKIISAWLNDSRDNPEQKYLSVKNVSSDPIIIEPGESIFLNMTPKKIRDDHPSVPLFSKSIKVEETQEQPTGKDLADDVPF